MSSFRAALLRELRRLVRDPIAIVLLVAGPVGVFVLLAALFVREVPTDLPVAVLDLDHSSLSRRLTRMLDASATLATFAVVDRAEGQRAMQSGRAYAVIEIPPETEHDLKNGRAASVICSYDAQLMLPASLVRRAVRTVVGTLSAGIELKIRTARGATSEQALAQFEPIRMDVHTLFNPRLSYAFFLLVALIPAMLQVFIVMASIWATGLELREGTAGEWVSGVRSSRLALLTKAIPLVAFFTVLALAAQATFFRAFHLPIAFTWQIVAGTLLFVVASCAMGIAIAVVTCNLRFGLSVGAFVSGPAFAFAGITFPYAGMPPAGRVWSSLLPLTHVLRVLTAASRGWTAGVAPFVAMGAIAFGATAIALVAARRIANAELWGRA